MKRLALPAPAPTFPPRKTYSAQRLRLVVTLLTVVTLPIVVGVSVLVYYYLRYSRMVEQRLQGEAWVTPARLYARPMVLRLGMPLSPEQLVKILNDLKYEQKTELPQASGQFVAGPKTVAFSPQSGPEALSITFDNNRIKEIRGLETKKLYPNHVLEPELITYLFGEREKRRLIRYDELPDHLVKAVLAIEDRRFFSHPGVDPFRIVAAAVKNAQAESYIYGGASTITQQWVKNFFLTPERTMRRKIQEAILAFVLERRLDKKQILELYLNEIYLGQVGTFSIHGVGEAARMYFHKDVGNLTLPEAALIAGMIHSPNPLNPYRHPDRATERRNQVLRAMREAEFIEPATAEAAMARPVKVQTPSVDTTEAPYFVDLVNEELRTRWSADMAGRDVAIQTSLDQHLQAVGQQVLNAGLDKVQKMLRKKSDQPVQGALIAVEPASGAILALVGGRSYGESQYNRATQAKRQPGSTFKPFVYLAAFEATFDDPSLPPITPATVVDDAPTVFQFERKEYAPQNYENKYMGYVTLRRALAHSLNNATVKVAEMVGYQRVADMWSTKLGMDGNIKPYPALALGSFEATPLEIATAYNVFANSGMRVDPTTILRVDDAKGPVEPSRPLRPRRVVHPESAFLVTNMMRSVLNNGTAAAARTWGFTADAAGKTGTTNDLRDAWFAGFTPDLLCVVWVGFDDNTPINLSGAKAALPIWVDFMKAALAGAEPRQFAPPPSNVVFVQIDAETGLLASPYCPKTMSESFIAGTEPIEVCQWHSPDSVSPYGTRPSNPTDEATPPPFRDEDDDRRPRPMPTPRPSA
jgi:penicillin-binding protein 1B